MQEHACKGNGRRTKDTMGSRERRKKKASGGGGLLARVTKNGDRGWTNDGRQAAGVVGWVGEGVDAAKSEYRDTPSGRNRYGDGQGDRDHRGMMPLRCLYFSRKHRAGTDPRIHVARGFRLCFNVDEMMNFRPVWKAIVVNISPAGNLLPMVILAVFVLRERTDARCR